MVKAAVEGLGVCTLLKDVGEGDPLVRMHADATAAKGIIERKGLSKVRHIDGDGLWFQEQQARRVLPLTKVLGTENLADSTTMNLTANAINGYAQTANLDFGISSSDIAQKLNSAVRVGV